MVNSRTLGIFGTDNGFRLFDHAPEQKRREITSCDIPRDIVQKPDTRQNDIPSCFNQNPYRENRIDKPFLLVFPHRLFTLMVRRCGVEIETRFEIYGSSRAASVQTLRHG
jgi:hypothetical protein